MAAKILQSLTDDNPDLQKQIGCMNGIFQLFDRQNMLTGGRRIVGHSPKRLPPGKSHFNGGTLQRESNSAQLKSSSEHSHSNMQDRQRLSTESSRASFSSSSRSSSFSSLDCNRASQLEPLSFVPSILQSDIRDFVKDSMYREVQGLSNKAKTIDEKQTTHAELKESLTVLAKLQEAPRHHNEPRELSSSSSYHSKNGSSFSVSKDAPQNSYDGSKSTLKLKDLPRLSLDCSRPPSVVAKLMGLEMLPNEDSVSISSSFENQDSTKPIQPPTSPSWRNPDRSMKPMSRFPMEPAPWKQIDWTKGSRKPASRSSSKGPAKGPTTFPSVYSEIENRLKDLEFEQSGKDLRALKQILEAMQAKRFLETSEEGQDSNFQNHKDYEQKDNQKASTKRRPVSAKMYESPIVVMKPAKPVQKSGIPSASVIPLDGISGLPKLRGGENVENNKKGLSSGRTSKDPIFKSSQRENAANSVNTKDNRTLRSTHTSARQLAKNGSGKISGSISPKMQQKKPDAEKRSHRPNNPNLTKSKRLLNKQQAESNSSDGRRRPKVNSSQQSDEQLSEVSFDSRNLGSHENEDSAQSNETIIKKSLTEEDSAEFGFVPPEYSSPVSVLDNVGDNHDSPSPIKYVGKTLKVDVFSDKERNPNATQHSSVDNFASNSTESSGTFVINRKKLQNIDNLVQKLRRLNSSHDEARTDYIASLCDNTDPDNRYVSEILLASGLLLRDLTDFQFHPSGNPINPELFLVLEQTKASKTTQLGKTEKYHRKVVFDVVNEILATKLAFASQNSEPWLRPVTLSKKALNAQKLLRELCCEIEGLQGKNAKCSSDDEDDDGWKSILCEDVMNRSERWTGFDGEVSGAVLDIERLIFKDLVDEVVLGESAGLIAKSGRHKLFVK